MNDHHTNTRERLIGYLKTHQGDWVSGVWLSEMLEVSRNSVSKHVRQLKRAGYSIAAVTRKGYRLETVPDLLVPTEIRDGLDPAPLGLGEIHCLAQTDSTNRQARILAEMGAAEGTLIVAEQQNHGRGRKGRVWCSPAGKGVYLSLVLRPALLPPMEAPAITLLAGVAAAETLVRLVGLDARIKWPNDILINGRKIAGILTEINTEMDAIDYVILGMGVNVNTAADDLDEAVRPHATSIFLETGQNFPRVAFIREFINGFGRDYTRMQTEGFRAVRDRWKALADIVGRRVRVEVAGRTFRGHVTDVDEEGFLLLREENGDLRRVISGDVIYA